jgi:hypothetical protein
MFSVARILAARGSPVIRARSPKKSLAVFRNSILNGKCSYWAWDYEMCLDVALRYETRLFFGLIRFTHYTARDRFQLGHSPGPLQRCGDRLSL